MKLIAFVADGFARFGALLGQPERAVDLSVVRALRGATAAAPRSLQELIEQGQAGLHEAYADLDWAAARGPEEALWPLAQVRLLAPTGMPPKITCFSIYEGHFKNGMEAFLKVKFGPWRHLIKGLGLARVPPRFYQKAVYYKGNNASYSGPEEDILWPSSTRMMDYEMELGVVLGSGGLNLKAEDAMKQVFGYTVFNDWSARDLLISEFLSLRGPLKGKDFGNGNTIGPCVVTKDEIPDPHQLDMQVRVNGELRGRCNTSGMTHRIEAQIAEASRHEPVIPGELIGTGCATNGCGFEQLRFLKPGDQVEIEIEKIGVLRNRVATQSC
jgi:2-keto-4-pentenoate hydratase/2-oxohepta-3-ene-1,7-dioic acid hydratase in catechol pathway